MPLLGRRDFIGLLGGSVAWPAAAFGQSFRMRRIGVLSSIAADDPETQARLAVLEDSLRKLGWTAGQNLMLDYRWGAGDVTRLFSEAKALVETAPDVILAIATTSLSALAPLTRTIPIVFVQAADPVVGGYVESLARPGRNITGFAQVEFSVAIKWLELLKEMVPGLAQVIVVHDAAQPNAPAFRKTIETASRSFGVQVSALPVRDSNDIQQGLGRLAEGADRGLIVLSGPLMASRRDLVVSLAEQMRLPAVYPFSFFPKSGGLISYGVDNKDLIRQTSSYIDRILNGENPAELPVQMPAKFELVINLKTAKALGLEVPLTLLARADEVIE